MFKTNERQTTARAKMTEENVLEPALIFDFEESDSDLDSERFDELDDDEEEEEDEDES